MTTDKSSEREAFEAWAATVMLNLKRLYAGYFHEATAFAWLAWQARAALPQQAQEAPSPADRLHAQIMNLPHKADERDRGPFLNGYLQGFKDARHAAAELVVAAITKGERHE